MSDEPPAVEILDSPEVKKLVLLCGCAAILQVDEEQPVTVRSASKGASFYFCAVHAAEPVALVYDVQIEKVEDPFAWDYKVAPGLPT